MKRIGKIILVSLIVSSVFINVYLSRENYKATTNIIQSQGLFLQLQTYFNELNSERNRLIEEQIDEKLKKVEAKEVKPTFEYLKSVTVRILNIKDITSGMGSIGTGSIIKVTEDYTYIITNRHVAPIDANLIMVEKNDRKYKAEVLKNAYSRDLSLIRITGKIPNTNVVKGLTKTKEQDKIYSVGMYNGFQDIYSEGTVAGMTPNGSRLINMPSLYGCSGSGIFNSEGEMVAVLYAITAYGPLGVDTAKAWCVPFIAIYTFLEEIL